MAQKFLNGVHISGATQLDFMPTHESEGIITLGRYDSNTSRYHNVKSYVSSTAASNYLKFSLHNGTANTVVDVLTLNGNQTATFAGNVQTGHLGVGTAPTSRQLSVYRSTAGSIANFLHYTDASTFQGLYIQVSQTTNDVILQSSGSSGGGFKFYAGNAEKAGISASGNASFEGSLNVGPGPSRFTDQQNAGSRLELYNNRQDLGNVEVYRIAAYNGAEVAGVHFYRGGGGSSGNTRIFAKKNNASALEQVVQFGTNDALTTTFAGNVRIQKNTPVLELGTSNTSTGNSKLTFFSKNNSAANAYSLQFNKDTGIDRLEFIDGSGNANIKFNNGGSAIFAGNVTCGQIDATSFTDVITNTIMTASADLDIKTVLSGRDIRFRGVSDTMQFRIKGDNTGVLISDIAAMKGFSVTSATATTSVASVLKANYSAVFFDFLIKKAANVRAGTVTAAYDGTSVSFTETSTVDLGDTSDVTLSVVVGNSTIFLQAVSTSSTWTIKSLIRAL